MASNRVTRVEGLRSIESLASPSDEKVNAFESAIRKPRMKTMDSLTRPMPLLLSLDSWKEVKP